MTIYKSNIGKWTKALRSGKFNQTKNCLEDFIGYCCLGVACKIFIPEEKISKRLMQTQAKRFKYGKQIFGNHPSDQKYSPEWLKDINDNFYDKSGKYLTHLNDKYNFTFDEIADLLEAVYIHEVLK